MQTKRDSVFERSLQTDLHLWIYLHWTNSQKIGNPHR